MGPERPRLGLLRRPCGEPSPHATPGTRPVIRPPRTAHTHRCWTSGWSRTSWPRTRRSSPWAGAPSCRRRPTGSTKRPARALPGATRLRTPQPWMLRTVRGRKEPPDPCAAAPVVLAGRMRLVTVAVWIAPRMRLCQSLDGVRAAAVGAAPLLAAPPIEFIPKGPHRIAPRASRGPLEQGA